MIERKAVDINGNELNIDDKVLYCKHNNNELAIGTIAEIVDAFQFKTAMVFIDSNYSSDAYCENEVWLLKDLAEEAERQGVIKAEEETAEKVIERKTDEKHCPKCNQYLGTGEIPEIKYCFNCGQHIYWRNKQ